MRPCGAGRRCAAALALAFLLPPAGAALPPGHVPVRSYGPAEGLPDVSVRALLQDRPGFIWLAAEEGLYRYDGHRFEPLGQDFAATALHEDAAGRLWIGSRSGLRRWNGQDFELIAGSEGLDIAALTSADGVLWVAASAGAFVLEPRAPLRPLPDWPGEAATALAAGPQPNEVWIARWNGQAEIRHRRGGRWESVPLPADAARRRVDALARDGAGRIWARQGSSLLHTEAAAGPARFVGAGLEPAIAARLKSGRSQLIAGRSGDLWLPLDDGLMHYAGGRWNHLDIGASLPAPWTRAVLEDREGNLWIGSRGLHRLLRHSPFRAYAAREGLDGNSAWGLRRDRAGRLWLAGTGLAQLAADGRRTVAGTEDRLLLSLTECSNNILYTAGLPGDAVLRHDPADGSVQRLELGALAAARVIRLLCDRDDQLWVATEDAGLLRARAGAPAEFARVELPGGTPNEFIGDIRQDSAGRIWVAGRQGLALWENGRWRRYTRRDGLREDHVAYLLPLRNGDLLAGYFGAYGVAQLRQTDGGLQLLRHLDRPGAPSSIYLLGEDAQSRLWLGGSRGLDRLDARGWQHFGRADGLIGEDVNNMAFLAEADGTVWIGTSAGLARLEDAAAAPAQRADAAAGPGHVDGAGADPAQPGDAAASHTPAASLPPQTPPPVQLTRLRLGGREFAPDARALRLPAAVTDAEFRYAALSYADEEYREYRSRLLGHDPEFRSSRNNELRYAGLRAGDYRFEVQARGRAGTWGAPAGVDFTILPPWWQSIWLRVLLGVAAAALVLLALRWRLSVLQARNRALEQAIDARTAELRRSNHALLAEIDVRTAAEQALSALNTEERRRKERFHLITRIAALISANLDADTLLQQSAAAVHEVLGYAGVAILLLDGSGDQLLPRARSGTGRVTALAPQRLAQEHGVIGAAVRERRLQCVTGAAAVSHGPPVSDAPGGTTPGARPDAAPHTTPAAALAVPILIGDSVLGVLHVESAQAFDDLDCAGLAIVADYLAVALENARLFRQASESAILAERRRVAHDLHDNIIQILSSISLQAQTLAHISATPTAELMQRAARVAELAQLAVREMRALLLELRPPEASSRAASPDAQLPLADSVQQLLRLMVPAAIALEFDFSRYVPQQPAQEQALLRIIQEAVSNAVRHAGASILRVVGSADASQVRVAVADNGRGMPRRRRQGLGQESMRARVAALGGQLRAGTGQPHGTVLEVELPRRDR
ncbi:two-component regulator propeller domain-containing protein [Tahibacter harae]|uniref:Histidine kinase n=1 Tax=Tahibacter harae TaxID=2963937 RepID=A0ABT1QN29_9GAMM|nr:two-component regulator propeller domain-containing protein [Tahibacter harae]MCQ4163944.1 histidine kinase [Tahibacter harae]